MKRQPTRFAARGRSFYGALRDEAGPPRARSTRTDLILIDSRAIRQKALKAHRKAEQTLEGLKGQLERYHERDLPGFRRWLHATFGALLTQQRSLQETIEQKQHLLMEIADLADRLNLSEAEAYRKALWRQAHPAEAEEEDRRFAEAERNADRDIFGEDDAWNADETDEPDEDNPFAGDFDIPESDQEAFKSFFEATTGRRLSDDFFRGKSAKPRPENKSARELYRAIVRRLHPDHHGQMNDARKNLWHETQDAYRRRDVDALRSILSRCDGGESALGLHSPVALILRLTERLKVAARTTRREVRRHMREMAWDYERRIKIPHFVQRVRSDLEGILRDLTWQLDELNSTLAMLERQAARGPRRRRSRAPRGDRGWEQELPF